MPLLGKSVVAIWNDVVPEGRDEYVEWHNREHMPERVAIPGFIRGRRFVSHDGSPHYYTLYEAENEDVLSGPHYQERLNNPTTWTRKTVTTFRNTSRGICQVALSEGHGDGGFMLTLRFAVSRPQQDEMIRHLSAEVFPVMLQMPGVTGAHLCITNKAVSGLDSAERRRLPVQVPDWIVMVEASSADAAREAGDKLIGDVAANPASSEVGLYGLEICRLGGLERRAPRACPAGD